MKHNSLITDLAEQVREAGGRAMLVGGCVRDEILGIASKDIDIEIYGLEPERLREVLGTFGKVDEVGASFAVYKLGQDIDVSLPRREKKTGVGHKGFTVEGDPHMSFEEACSRRDFTINAIMKDPLTDELVDPWGGVIDLQNGILRAVSDKAFQEDSLRVLRCAQFASRFGFEVDSRTQMLAYETDLSDLPKERIWGEMEKLLTKSPNLPFGVTKLESLGIVEKLFPSFRFNEHLADGLFNSVFNVEGLSYEERLTVILTMFAYGSEYTLLDELGVNSVNGYPVRKHVEAILDNMPFGGLETDYDFHKLSQKISMKLMARVVSCFPTAKAFATRFAETIDRLRIEEEPIKPVVTGKYLIQYGMEPSPKMGEVLEELYDLQMQGVVHSGLWELARNRCGVSDVLIEDE
jgi:tRNA nucleotidyltransferase (CCA-adding enzyme)